MLTLGAASMGAALATGIAASGHCLAMCGGVAGALATRGGATSTAARIRSSLTYNLARIGSYAIAGTAVGGLGGGMLRALDITLLATLFRILAGAIMVAAAGRLLFGWRVLEPLEGAGAALWHRLAPHARRSNAARGGTADALRLGLIWGLLPCGMSYSMLLLAATTGSAAAGAGTMAAFGIGTLPVMITATAAFSRLTGRPASRAAVSRIAGALLLLFGLWTVTGAVAGRHARHDAQHFPSSAGTTVGPHHHH